MNYFRGNGGCGLSMAPKYNRETENNTLDQSVYNESVVELDDNLLKQDAFPYDQLYQTTD